MKMALGVRLGTSLSLTPQLQMAIRLLQLSTLELEQEIQQQLDSNPLLDSVDHTELAEAAAPAAEEGEPLELDSQMNQQQLTDDLPVDTQWDDIYTHQPTTLGAAEAEDRQDNTVASASLHEHLARQVELLSLNPVERVMAHFLLDAIDERGLLTESLDDLLQAVNQLLADQVDEPVELDELQVVLKHIQHLDPVGVGARDLAECLELQLHALPEQTPHRAAALALLADAPALAQNDLARLRRQTGLDLDAISAAMNLIRTLDPYPGQRFGGREEEAQKPDVVVRRLNNRWVVQLNTEHLPRLRIHPYYSGLIRRADQSADNQYLRQHLQEARAFIKSVDERHRTLLRVTSCIVAHQQGFLEHGPQAMKPLVLREIAEETGLHESTISRVTTHKYLLTPRGLFELKYFFSSHVGTQAGGECSSTAIRAMIKQLIQGENPKKPFSDQYIAEKLQADGIDVARRTVAKYRESMNIPSSSERKRLL